MPVFRFTGPDGRSHSVTGPPGSTPEQAFQVLQQTLGGAAAMERQAQPRAEEPPMNVDPTEGMSWGQKALTNVGAGMDTAWQGAKQLVGQGMTDEELREKRKIDEHLAAQTTGGGALQLAGEIAPTIPLGLGAGAAAGRMGGLAQAMARSPTMSAAAGGAGAGALQPVTSDESRLANMAMGAGGGAVAAKVAPQALRLAMAGGRGAGTLAQRGVAALPDQWTGRVGERAVESLGGKRTAKLLQRELGDTVPPDIYTPHPHIGGPGPTAAGATQDPALAALERGSRTTGGEHWMDYDRAAKTARWEAIDQGLQTEADLTGRLGQANAIGKEVNDLYPKIGKTRFFAEMDDFFQKLQTAKNTPQYHGNPAVKSAVDYIENTMRLAGEVTPELLHTMRRTVAGGLAGVPGVGSAATRAASSEPFVISLTKAMDDILDKSSKGKFGQWKSDYSEMMTKADSAKADVNIRSKFIDPATGMPLKPTVGMEDIPDLQPHALTQAVKSAASSTRGVNKGKNLLATPSQDILEGVAKDLRAQDIISRSKKASTGGGGSDTASNLTQAALMESLFPTGLGVGRYAMAESGRKADKAMQRQLAELLQDPAKLRAFVAAQERLRLLRGAGQLPQAALVGQSIGGAMPALLGQ